MAKAGRPEVADKRNIEIRFRVNEEENERLEKLAKSLQMNKSRLIRNIVLGDLKEAEIMNIIGLLPIFQKLKAYKDRINGIDYWEEIKKED